MHEMYFQIFRNVCIFFIYVCVCVFTYIEKGEAGREGDRNRDRERREISNGSKCQQVSLDKGYMVLPSMQLFHKFSYFQINTFLKQTIACCPGFYLNFEISAFDSCSYHHHHTQTPEMCNASFKSYLTFCPRQEIWDPLHISTGFYKMLKKSTTPSPPTNFF